MTQRHPIQNEAIMLITTNVLGREPLFRHPTMAREAIECLYRLHAFRPFIMYGFVVMPDHCHFLLKILKPYTISRLMSAYKSGLTFDLGIPKLWQRRFHVRIIDGNPTHALRYIHLNPVRAGLSESPESYPWSSASGRWDVSPIERW
jgi:putative transposase